jgi:hypothetical protein
MPQGLKLLGLSWFMPGEHRARKTARFIKQHAERAPMNVRKVALAAKPKLTLCPIGKQKNDQAAATRSSVWQAATKRFRMISWF